MRLACTQGGVLALDRDLRIAFVLGFVFELPGEVAAEVLEIEPAAFRKRLQRAKDRASEFLLSTCGLVNPAAPCRCERVVRARSKGSVWLYEHSNCNDSFPSDIVRRWDGSGVTEFTSGYCSLGGPFVVGTAKRAYVWDGTGVWVTP